METNRERFELRKVELGKLDVESQIWKAKLSRRCTAVKATSLPAILIVVSKLVKINQ